MISTTAEPWLLLPFFYAWKRTGLYAEYGQEDYVDALEDFCQSLPHKHTGYFAAVRAFALDLYTQASDAKASYFLDKTPRYHLIAPSLLETFPDSKVIILWRNPLAIAASMMETWAQGKWNLYRYHIDFYTGLPNLIDVSQRFAHQVYCVRYEDLIADPEVSWPSLFAYLDIPFEASLLKTFPNVQLDGRMGDPTGTTQYDVLNKTPLGKWHRAFNNPLRKAWARRYIEWIGPEDLSTMGYQMNDLLTELNQIPTSANFLVSDVVRRVAGLLFPWIAPHTKLRALSKKAKDTLHL